MIDYRNGVSFVGEYRGQLVVEGICLIAVVCDWFVTSSLNSVSAHSTCGILCTVLAGAGASTSTF